MKKLLLAVLLLAAAGAAHADKYRVDLIVFADRTGVADEQPLALQVPNVKGALEPGETAALHDAGIEILPDDQFGLGEAWNHLKNSRNHQPLVRMAWLQQDPPGDKPVALRVHNGAVLNAPGGPVYPLDGSIALLAGRFLHIDADFASTQVAGNGDLVSYRLREKRRVKRDELHHLDGAKLGLLVQVTRVDVPARPKKKKK